MRVLFAIRDENNIISTIVRKYQQNFEKKFIYNEVHDFTAIIKELQKSNGYDRIIVSEDIDERLKITSKNKEEVQKRIKKISKLAEKSKIIYITKNEKNVKTLIDADVYSVIVGEDKIKKNIFDFIVKPNDKNKAFEMYNIKETKKVENTKKNEASKKSENTKKTEPVKEVKKQEKVAEAKAYTKSDLERNIKYLNREDLEEERYVTRFDNLSAKLSKKDLNIVIDSLSAKTKRILKKKSDVYKELIKDDETSSDKSKGRGRPRKGDNEESTEKKRRGRPRKEENDKVEEPKKAVKKVAAVAATATAVANIDKIKDAAEKSVKKSTKKVDEAKKEARNKVKSLEDSKKEDIVELEPLDLEDDFFDDIEEIKEQAPEKEKEVKKDLLLDDDFFDNDDDFDDDDVEDEDFEDFDEDELNDEELDEFDDEDLDNEDLEEDEFDDFEDEEFSDEEIENLDDEDLDDEDLDDEELDDDELEDENFDNDDFDDEELDDDELDDEDFEDLDDNLEDSQEDEFDDDELEDFDDEEFSDEEIENLDDEDLDDEELEDLDDEDFDDDELEDLDDDDFDDEELEDIDDDELDDEDFEEDEDLDEVTENSNKDDDELSLIDDDDYMDLDDDSEDDDVIDLEDDSDDDIGIINLDEDDEDIINLDDDAEEDEDNDIINLDDDLEDDEDSDIINLDDDTEEDDDSDMLNLDDDAEEDEDNDIINLDEDLEDDEDSDIINLDEDAEEDNDIISLDDESEDEEDNDIISLDEDSEEDDDLIRLDDDEEDVLKLDDEESSNVAAFSGIKNKNYNPNYNISSQLNEINEEETVEDKSQEDETQKAHRVNTLEGQKVVAFVGAHGNGTSFIINNLACLLSEQGIKVAILDLTKNKNSYYIYTENEENLRSIAFSCFDKLKSGIADGIKVNKNLTVYTSLPNSGDELEDKENAINTILNNNSLVLLDCDVDTNYEYFEIAQEIYLVQTLDILTIQPLTSFLKKLNMNKALDEEKIRILINKDIRVNELNDRILISAMSVYNSPDTTYQQDLFNRDTVQYLTIPFEERNYAKYLSELAKCKLKISGYSKALIGSFNKLAKMVYPIGKKKK